MSQSRSMARKSTAAQNGSSARAVRELVVVQREVLAGEVADHVAEREVVEARLQLGHAPLDRFGRDVVDDRWRSSAC